MSGRDCTPSARWGFWMLMVLLAGAASPLSAMPPMSDGADVPGSSDPAVSDPGGPPPPYVTVISSGPSSNRVDVVFLGDGYTASEIDTTYAQHVSNTANYMFGQSQQPFALYHNFFNVHRVTVVSNESGADIPPEGIYRDTALDASYFYDGSTDRLLYINTSKANSAMSAGLAGAGFTAEMRLVTVNHTRYGGGGGAYAVFAGGNSWATEIALHELGHSFGGLADEYDYSGGAKYTGSEPGQPNVTTSPTGNKWARWLGYVDPDHPEMGAIGAYEGAMYHTYGIYRPSQNSKMRNLGPPFDAVGREQLILGMYNYVYPLDAWLGTAGTLTDPASLWVDTVDPAIIHVDWYVDGSPVAVNGGEAFSLQSHGYGPGTYDVRSHAYDATGWVRLETTLTWQDVNWTVMLTPEPATLALLAFGGLGLLWRRAR